MALQDSPNTSQSVSSLTCHANMSVNIGEIFPLSEKINFVLLLVHIFLLTGCMSTTTVYGGYVLIFFRMKAFRIILTWYISIYTRVIKVRPVEPD
jgi:hypothetical protein